MFLDREREFHCQRRALTLPVEKTEMTRLKARLQGEEKVTVGKRHTSTMTTERQINPCRTRTLLRSSRQSSHELHARCRR